MIITGRPMPAKIYLMIFVVTFIVIFHVVVYFVVILFRQHLTHTIQCSMLWLFAFNNSLCFVFYYIVKILLQYIDFILKF